MRFKTKIFKLGHGYAIYLPKNVYTKLTEIGEYDFEVYTNGEAEEETGAKVYTKKKKFLFDNKDGVNKWV